MTDRLRIVLQVLPAAPAGIALMLLTASPVAAHGPCGCLDPVKIGAGGEVRITGGPGRGQSGGAGWPAYRVVFNPDPTDFGSAPDYLSGAHRADVPTTRVLSRPRRRPTRKGRFRVPPGTPPGLYMVQIFDGSEGGSHSTYDYLHVVDFDDPEQGGVVAHRSRRAGEGAAGREIATRGGPAATLREDGRDWPLLGAVALGGLAVGMAAGARRRGRLRA